MKTTLIEIHKDPDQVYYLGLGIGFEKDKYGYFVGILIAFLSWTIRIGILREVE